MAGPEIRLLEGHSGQRHRHPCDIAGFARKLDHLGDQRLIAPAVGFGAKAGDQGGELFGIGDMAADGVGLDRDLFHLKKARGGGDLIDRALQLPTDRIAGREGKKLCLIGLDELLEDAARGGEFHIQKRRGLLAGGQQDELPVRPAGVEIAGVVEFIADLGGIARQVDVEIGESGGLARQMLQRAVVPLDQGRGGDLDQVAEHEASGDEAVHGVAPLARAAHPIPPHKGEGAALGAGRAIWHETPPLPLVGRGWGWGAARFAIKKLSVIPNHLPRHQAPAV